MKAEICIDKDGIWYYRGAEMFRREIVELFYRHLHRDAAGGYHIDMAGERCAIDVEDAPYVVTSVSRTGGDGLPDAFMLRLNDGTTEPLAADTLQIGQGHVLYCAVRDGLFLARFSRPAYYQLASWITGSEDAPVFTLALNGRHYIITHRQPSAAKEVAYAGRTDP